MRITGFLCLPLLILTAVLLPAAEDTDTPPRRLLLYYEEQGVEDFSHTDKLLLYESLLLKLGTASRQVAILEYTQAQIPDSQEKKTEQARVMRADSWIHAALSGSKGFLTVHISSYDLLLDELVFEYDLEKMLDRLCIGLEKNFWEEVVESVRENYKEGGKRILHKLTRGKVVIKAQPGTRIVGLSDEYQEVDSEGEFALEVVIPATISFEALCRNYYPLEYEVFLDEERSVIKLDQAKGSRIAVDFYLKNAQFPGFNFYYYPLPNIFFIRLGITSFLLGAFISNDHDLNEDLLVSRSINHLSITAGTYLNRENRYLRFYLACGAFTRIITAWEFGISIEPVAPFGIQPSFGMEFSKDMKRRLYVEYAPIYYVCKVPGLMIASFPPAYEPSGFVFLEFNPIVLGSLVIDTGVIEIINFRIGLRLQL